MASGIGETLRAARRQQGISLADAAAATRVRETYLAALEEEEFGALGGDVYVKGFLRSYARYLTLDPEPLVAAYRREHERVDELPPLGRRNRRGAEVEPTPFLRRRLVAAGVVVVILFLGLRLLGGDGGDAVAPSGPTPTETPTMAPVTTVVPGDTVSVVVTADAVEAEIHILADGETAFAGLLPAGQTQTAEGARSVTVSVSRGDVGVRVNGDDHGRVGGGAGERTFVAQENAGESA